MKALVSRLSPSMLISVVALFIALGGTGYAAVVVATANNAKHLGGEPPSSSCSSGTSPTHTVKSSLARVTPSPLVEMGTSRSNPLVRRTTPAGTKSPSTSYQTQPLISTEPVHPRPELRSTSILTATLSTARRLIP